RQLIDHGVGRAERRANEQQHEGERELPACERVCFLPDELESSRERLRDGAWRGLCRRARGRRHCLHASAILARVARTNTRLERARQVNALLTVTERG